MPSRRTLAVVGLLSLTAVAAGGYVALRTGLGPLRDAEGCTATASGYSVALSIDQAQNASLIAAVAQRRGLPARAVTIAIATAYQESKLENLDSGDRDSLGLFQQRPSQGWGKPAQILDRYHATNAFYDALVQVDGYQEMEITAAAQAVQRSGFPDAYADHEQDGRTVASAMTGSSHAALTCTVDPPEATNQPEGPEGLTAAAATLRSDLTRAFGDLSLGGFTRGGVTQGHMAGSAHYEGRAIDIFVRPVNADNQRRGWAIAHYLVANAKRLGVSHVIFDARIWTAGTRSSQGWRAYDAPSSDEPATQAVLEHRDHVHVDVA